MQLVALFYQSAVQPYEEQAENRLEFFNQSIIFVIMVLMFTFTDLVTDVNLKRAAGYTVLVLIFLNVLVNFILVMKSMIPSCKKFY